MSEITGKLETTTEMILEIVSEGPRGPAGEDGKDGKDGAAGKAGYTPVRGVDYWTEADITEIEAYNEAFISDKLTAEYPKKVSELENDKGYLTEETDPTVPAWAKEITKPAYTASEVGADVAGTAAAKVTVHNASETAHNDIRILVSELTARLNALANSDDTTLDQMAEIVAYIKANRDLIESVTTAKVNVADIIDDLTTSLSDKPLSAKQGVVLKGLIEAVVVPTKTSELTNDSGYFTADDLVTDVDNNNGSLYTPLSSMAGANLSDRINNLTFQDVGAPNVNVTLTLVGTDANGDSHTWTVYGQSDDDAPTDS